MCVVSAGRGGADLTAPPGINVGSQKPGHQKRSAISLKHVYEIAKARAYSSHALCCAHASEQVKQTDSGSEFIPLQSICTSIIGTAKSMGVDVVR